MGWRTIVVHSRAKLELKNNYLVIRSESVTRVHLDEISILMIENTGSAVTVSLLEALWTKKICVIFCDRRRNPGAQLIPYYNSHDCSAKIQSQINWPQDFKDMVWCEIIRQKIQNQAKVLYSLGIATGGNLLMKYVDEVECPDITNREGHSAKVYFNALRGSSFSRSDDCFFNSALNYGYGVLLSCMTREIVANGYLTQLGLFHHNVFNEFNLGSDLMEPFRPLVDSIVLKLEEKEELTHEDKIQILSFLDYKVVINNSTQSVKNAISIYVKSVFEAIENCDISAIRFYRYGF